MLNGGLDFQARVLLLPAHHLRALLHARHRVLGLLLAGPQRCPGQVGVRLIRMAPFNLIYKRQSFVILSRLFIWLYSTFF